MGTTIQLVDGIDEYDITLIIPPAGDQNPIEDQISELFKQFITFELDGFYGDNGITIGYGFMSSKQLLSMPAEFFEALQKIDGLIIEVFGTPRKRWDFETQTWITYSLVEKLHLGPCDWYFNGDEKIGHWDLDTKTINQQLVKQGIHTKEDVLAYMKQQQR